MVEFFAVHYFIFFRTQVNRLSEQAAILDRNDPNFGRYEIDENNIFQNSIFSHPELVAEEYRGVEIVLGDRILIRSFVEGSIEVDRQEFFYRGKNFLNFRF